MGCLDASCPTPTAHKRLREAHRFWHGCLTEYDDLEGFRTNLNACIQALRNVTWVIQKEKRNIDNFNSWYGGWQEKLKSDDVMRWIVKSRNRIVKEGDLEVNSMAIVRLVLTYFDAADAVGDRLQLPRPSDITIQLPPRTKQREYLSHVRQLGIPSQLLKDGSVNVERRWVDRALPEWELLDALAYGYAFLIRLVSDAHKRAGFVKYDAFQVEDSIILEERVEHPSGKPSCMVVTQDLRTSTYRLGSGEALSLAEIPIERDEEILQKAIEKYGVFSLPNHEEVKSITEYVPYYTEMAIRVLKSDQDHLWIISYFIGTKRVGIQPILVADKAEKYLAAQRLANMVDRFGIDGLISVADSWIGRETRDEDGVLIPPGELSDRREALAVFAEDAFGNKRYQTTTYTRTDDGIVVDETLDDTSAPFLFFQPTSKVWESWRTQQSRSTEGDSSDSSLGEQEEASGDAS